MNKNQFNEIAISLKFTPNKDVLDSLFNEFNEIENSLNILKSINIENVKPLSHINEQYTFFLREDEVLVDELLKQDELLSNAKNIFEDYVMIPKVIK